MSTMVDNRWDPILQNQQGPITSGYVSNSDIRQRERKDQIKWERQREYEDLMNKPGEPEQGQQQQRTPPVYYKTGAAGNSLPLGSYEESRRTLDDQRQQEYNQFVAQKKDTENKRREELYRNSQQNYRPPPEPEMYDHGQIAKDLREERQKEYNDYLKQKISEEHSRIKHRHRYTPAGGLPIGQYDLQRKRLRDELSRDYKQSLLKQRQDQLVFRAKEFQLDSAPEYLGNLNEERPLVGSPRNSYEIPRYQREQEIHTRRQIPPTPPGGLNIATEQERKRVEDLKKTMYRDELLKQQKEQLYNRATQQGEVSVINRSSPTQAPPNQISPRGRPPPHPDSGRRRGPPPPQNDRMDKSRETPNYWNEGRQAPSPKSVESDSKNVQPKNGESETKNKQPMESHRPQEGELRTGFFDDRRQSPLNRDERHQDYQQFLANKQREDDMRHQRLEDQRHAPHLDLSKGDYYDAETYERKRQSLNSERKNDYQNFLSKQKENKPPMSQVKETEDFQTERRHVLAEERNREYNEFLEQKRKMRPITSDMGGITYASNYKKDTRPHSDRILSLYKALPPDQRSDMRLRPVTPDHWSASLSINEDAKTARKMSMNMERKREYNNYLKTQSSKKPQGLTKENTPQGYGSLHFNEEYSERREIAQKQALNEEYNQYLTKEGLKDEKVEPLQLEEDFQTRRQKELAMERHQDFVDFLEKMSNRQNMIADKLFTNRPSYRQYTPESLQGLPIGQTRYDHQKRQQEVQRNREYNEHLAKKGEKIGMEDELLTRRDMTLKKYMEDQVKSEMHDKKSPEQGRREWIDTSGPKGIIAGVDSYNYDKRKTFAEERKKEYKDIMEKPALERKPTTPINLNAVKIFPVGSGYTRRQRELQAERKKNFKDFAEKKNEIYKKQQENRESFREMLDRELMESPPIIPIGEYDTKKRQFKQEAHQEMVNFLERQPHGNRDKEFWNKVTKPRILPQSGEYKNRKQKLNDELRKDWRDFVLKQEPPRERIKEFGTPGAVLFTGEYEKTRQKVRDERTKDYHEFIQKHGGHAPRRMPDQAPANSIGFMANLGFHDREREKLNKERQGEYRKFLDEKAFGKEGMPRGRPNWVDGKVPPDSWFQQDPPPFHKSPVRDQEPPRDRPASYGRRQTPSYEEILDSKRREEASYRRFEDPEYSRAGGLGGPNDRYD
ncbi:trichohyalin-like isoform X5 [Mytilus californianus]|uniref:trichohyalin-like isoform X5 n=1 Tax=Mytilus californianus TaxID=6549 RepID=UPI0022457D5D|nr:trichohyalin-like isoform X5 [Mytilus californianus]